MKNYRPEPENIIFWHTPCFLIYDSPEFKEYPMHWHNAIEILMPTENIFPVVCGTSEYQLEENDILIIPAGVLHNLKAQKGKRIIMLCDNAMFKDNPALSEINMLLAEPVYINSVNDSGLAMYAKNIILEMLKIYEDQTPLSETMLFQKLLLLFMKIAVYKKGEGQKNKSSRNMELLKKYIDCYYMNPLTLDKLAEAVGYSKYYLSRLLNSNGTSFAELLNERRIKAAETLLNDDGYSVTQIAMDVGFTSITTFNRAFRSIKGCTPTQFRTMYRDNNI